MSLRTAALAALLLSACTSVETATVSSNEVAANGEAVAVIQASSLGITALFNFIDIIQSDLDTVNNLLVTEAKAMGANRVDLKHAWTTPRHGIFALVVPVLGIPYATGTGVAVK